VGITVCTGWHPAGYKEYARYFVETFHEHWPESVNLIAYTEEPAPMPRGECRSLWGIPGAHEFYERHRHNLVHCGKSPHPKWLPKDIRRGQSWRWDAVRFFKQLIIPLDASLSLPDEDVLVWLDADVVTFAKVPDNLVEKLLGRHELCYLGRNKGSEIGFWAVRLNKRTRAFLENISSLYLDDRVFTLNQFHSAWVWDYARRDSGMNMVDLTPNGRDHVFVSAQCPLHVCLDHCKGSRKALGHSPEHPIKWWLRA
jgi:hypothetical protein